MVDLNGQYVKIKSEINSAIQKVIDSSAFINGPEVKCFKEELSDYLGCKHTITCANGTDALQLALMSLNLTPGDEVLVPDFTFIASAEVIALLGLKPVFVDVDPNTFLLDLDKLRKLITSKSKVIIPVHLFGQCVNMQDLMSIANEYNLKIIEDNAQALGADVKIKDKWIKAGTVGHIGCTSFFPSKCLGCFGDGGAIFTNNEELGEELTYLANHGQKVKYYNDLVGVNSRLDTIQAAILSVKLNYLDNYIAARQKAADKYNRLLSDISNINIPQKTDYSTHVFHQYTLKAEKRDELKKFLQEKSIPAMIYYPIGMHNQKAYKTTGDFSVSDKLCKEVISLPMHTELTEDQQEYIAEAIKSFYN